MEKFIPYDKMSKKEKRAYNARKRREWGTLNPVTRKTTNRKAYNRRFTKDRDGGFAFALLRGILYS